MDSIKPIEFKRLIDGSVWLLITWSDGMKAKVPSLVLRQSCPCATCKEARGDSSHAKPLTGTEHGKPSLLKVLKSSITEEINLVRIWPIGTYALGVEWGDGHSTGIYTYTYLRELSVRVVQADTQGDTTQKENTR